MSQLPWYLYAFAAAIIWGIHYNLLSKALKVVTPITSYLFVSLIILLGLPLFWKQFTTDISKLYHSDTQTILSTLGLLFTGVTASLALYKAIQIHNPVHAGLIEVTYPLFVAIFAVILFQENHVNTGTIIGGTLILIGSGIVVYSGS